MLGGKPYCFSPAILRHIISFLKDLFLLYLSVWIWGWVCMCTHTHMYMFAGLLKYRALPELQLQALEMLGTELWSFARAACTLIC